MLKSVRTFLVVLTAALLSTARADVIISEFLANNNTGLTDEDGTTADWVELFNDGAATVNLAGWRLTDDSGNSSKWIFPAVDLAPNGFLIVFASAKNRVNPAANLHTNFKLSANGGYLALIRQDGSPSSVFNPYPAQYPDRPLRLIVPQAPGSASDTVARLVAAELVQQLKQQIVVDNRQIGRAHV